MAGEKDDLELKDLGQYYSTEGYTQIMGVDVTDGVSYVMNNGYGWFVTDMISVIICGEYPEVTGAEFLTIKLGVDLLTHKAQAKIEDGNGKVLYKQDYDYTDAKVKKIELFYENKVLLLPSER